MTNDTLIQFNEPDLEFRYGQRVQDPRDGLSLFGSYSADLSSHPASTSYIVVGTDVGIGRFAQFSTAISRPLVAAPDNNFRLWPPYPGFEVAFASKWPDSPVRTYSMDSERLLLDAQTRDKHERAYAVVERYLEALRATARLDERIGVAICVVPDAVWRDCRPESRVSDPIGERVSASELGQRRAGQMGLFGEVNVEQYHLSPDFRRQLKARAMEFGIPLQIVRESTLRTNDDKVLGQRQLTPLSNRLWNIGAALHYKCGGKPWRLSTARDGVCYIGIAFRRSDDNRTACCAAQMFLDSGDGIVFLGEFGPWYSPSDKEYHLSKQAAHNLLSGTLKTYAESGGKPLREIFLHSSSIINEEEFEGYKAACPQDVKLVGVRVRHADRGTPRLYRLGRMPVLRGTFWKIDERVGYLWGSGFQPRLGTYSGPEIPLPLRIDIQWGDASIERIASDIMGLTKLNYNACKLGDAEPVTIRFSRAVGEILVSNPLIKHPRPQFRYYI